MRRKQAIGGLRLSSLLPGRRARSRRLAEDCPTTTVVYEPAP